jgi:hypothetical protein
MHLKNIAWSHAFYNFVQNHKINKMEYMATPVCISVCALLPIMYIYIFFSSRFSIQEQLAISKLTQMGWQQGRTYLGTWK